MRQRSAGLPVALYLAALGGNATAAEAPAYLDRVESAVYQAEGDRAAITRRAAVCVSQILKPGVITAPILLVNDPSIGTIVANNSFEYPNTFFKNVTITQARSRMTLEAKDGRFRIIHQNIEQFLNSEWVGVSLVKYSGSDKIKATLDGQSASIAACITSAGAEKPW